MVVVAVLAAVALHVLVERPCNRLLTGRSRSVALAPPTELPVAQEHGDDFPKKESRHGKSCRDFRGSTAHGAVSAEDCPDASFVRDEAPSLYQ